VVDVDAALGEKLLDVAVGESVAQVPAHRHQDHVRREPKPGERARGDRNGHNWLFAFERGVGLVRGIHQ
jgi:hypothetical protein